MEPSSISSTYSQESLQEALQLLRCQTRSGCSTAAAGLRHAVSCPVCAQGRAGKAACGVEPPVLAAPLRQTTACARAWARRTVRLPRWRTVSARCWPRHGLLGPARRRGLCRCRPSACTAHSQICHREVSVAPPYTHCCGPYSLCMWACARCSRTAGARRALPCGTAVARSHQKPRAPGSGVS